MQPLKRHIPKLEKSRYPVKILQFGSSDFLLGFADWMVQVANEKAGFNAGISLVQGVSNPNIFHQKESAYRVVLKGIHEDEFIHQQYEVDIIQRVVNPNEDFADFLNEALNTDLQFIISNVSDTDDTFSDQDASVSVIASTFAGKLTQLLHHRFSHQIEKSLLILPIEHHKNRATLKFHVQKYCSHWDLPAEFTTWLTMHVTFCNSLVDRIVTVYPRMPQEQAIGGYRFDKGLVVEGEWFHQWVIEGPRWIEEVLPLRKAGLNVIYTDDLMPYQLRKARILNGISTCMTYLGLGSGLQSVRATIDHPVIGRFIKRMIYDDVIPVIPGDVVELEKYAAEVINRFRNPAFDHQLDLAVTDSFSKFKADVLPTMLAQIDKNGVIHDRLAFVLAALLFYYRPLNDRSEMIVSEREDVTSFMQMIWEGNDYSKKGMKLRCDNAFSS